LKALQEKLLRQDLFEEFCEEFTREMNHLRMEQRATISSAKREVDRIGIDAIILTPTDGEPPSRAGEEPRFGEPRLRIELKGNLAAMLGAATKCEVARNWRPLAAS